MRNLGINESKCDTSFLYESREEFGFIYGLMNFEIEAIVNHLTLESMLHLLLVKDFNLMGQHSR